MAFKNLSCRYPPRPNPSIPDHNTWQGMPWEHTEGLPTLRWWPESVFPGFPEMHHFCPANRPTHQVLQGQIFNPPCFCSDGYGLTLNLSGNKRIGEIRTRTHIHTPIPPFWQGYGTNPAPPLTLDPKLNNIYAEVLQLCIGTIGWPQMCSSGKGHEFPLFWVGNGWPDFKYHNFWRHMLNDI